MRLPSVRWLVTNGAWNEALNPATALPLDENATGSMGECKPYLHSTRPCELAWPASALHASDHAGSPA